VDELQWVLQVPIDGEFGQLTEAAVKSFQARAGLATDGIVGPDTWRAMLFDNPD
jgi:peptidoglycan hydrolase-like protein with peptidoglycan-binding domain